MNLSRLVIAEKPSVGRSIAKVLGAEKRGDGYMEGGGWIVSWCLGHLAQLADAETYDEKYADWRYDDLPIVPEPWKYTADRSKYAQLLNLKALMERSEVTELVNACDAGREGELIFRNVCTLIGSQKPVKRLWISSMEDAAIREGFAQLRPESDFDGLYQSALCRAKADWLVGINATRLFSVLYRRTLNVGRVLSPTLALLVQREAEIEAFKPVPFYTAELDAGFPAATERFADRKEVEAVAVACEGQRAEVRNIERREHSEKPPALFDLTTLQREANRRLGFTAKQTLDCLQSLYEKKLCTYPRTDARFLTDDMEPLVPALAAVAAALCGLPAPETVSAAQVCDSRKVGDHPALVPTAGAGRTELSSLPAGEREIMQLVARQLLCAVGEPFRYAETVVTLACGGSNFTAKGRTVLSPGWWAFTQREETEKPLPALSERQTLDVAAVTVREGKTTPPKHYTEDTLLAAMESAGQQEPAAEAQPEAEAARRGLGTPATRAATLEKLVSAGFMERQKAKKCVSLLPTHAGVSLVTVLPEQLRSPLLTAEWETRLGQIERGEIAPDAFLNGITDMVYELVRTYRAIEGVEPLFPSGREVVGRCPRCGGDVTESKRGLFCENRACRFGLWKENKYLAAKKITLTKPLAVALLRDGHVRLDRIWSDKTGKSYAATLTLTDDGEKTSYGIVFGK